LITKFIFRFSLFYAGFCIIFGASNDCFLGKTGV